MRSSQVQNRHQAAEVARGYWEVYRLSQQAKLTTSARHQHKELARQWIDELFQRQNIAAVAGDEIGYGKHQTLLIGTMHE